MPYNVNAIHQLLKEVFSDQKITSFCFDHFPPVYQHFASGTARLVKIQLLVDNAERRDAFEELFAQIKKTNPKQYARFEPSLEAPFKIPTTGLRYRKGRVEIILPGDLSHFSQEKREATIDAVVGAIAGVLAIPRDQIEILHVEFEIISLQLVMPKEAVKGLLALAEANDPAMQDLGIQQVREVSVTVDPNNGARGKSRRAGIAMIMASILVGVIIIVFSGSEIRNQVASLIRPLEFEPAAVNETLILIATFDRAEGVPDARIHNEIERKIQQTATENDLPNLRIEVESTLLKVDDRADAEALGQRYGASMVIWGEQTSVRTTVNFLNLREPSALPVQISETERSPSADPSAYARFVTENLPEQLAFIAFFAVGRSHLITESYRNAQKAIKAGIDEIDRLLPETRPQGLADAYFLLGWLYQEPLNETEQATHNYGQAIALKPDYADAYYNRGNVHFDSGNFQRAIADYTQVIKLNPADADAYYNRGNVHFDSGKFEQAILDYNQAIELNSSAWTYHYNRGLAYGEEGPAQDLVKAIDDFTEVIDLTTGTADVYYARGFAYARTGQFEEALLDFHKAIELDQTYVAAYFHRGLVYSEGGSTRNLAKAIEDFNQAIKLNPDYAAAFLQRGFAYAEDGNLEQALLDYNQAISLKLDYPDAYFYRGFAYLEAGRLEQALLDYDKSIELDPQFAAAYYERGRVYLKEGPYQNLAKAIENFDQSIALIPTYYDAYRERGYAHRAAGNSVEAVLDLEQYLELNPEAPDRKEIEGVIEQLKSGASSRLWILGLRSGQVLNVGFSINSMTGD